MVKKNFSRKRYLVTGGSGFIGSALVRSLVKDGYAVRVLDDFSRGDARRLGEVLRSVELIRGDVRDASSVRRAAKGVDSICHLACINGTEFFYSKPDLVLEVGVKGMMNVLDACEAEKVPELILASSSEVYHMPQRIPTDESVGLSIPDPMNPRYSYAAAKMISEILTINYGRKRLPRAVIFRPHNVFGPDMGWEHVIPEFALRMKKAAGLNPSGTVDFHILGTGRETRSFIYIDDFIKGLRLVMARGDHLGIYHIGSQNEISIRQVAEAVGRCFGRSIRVISSGAAPKGGAPRRCPDIRKIRALGFKPEYSFAEGLKRTVEWYERNSNLAPYSKKRGK